MSIGITGKFCAAPVGSASPRLRSRGILALVGLVILTFCRVADAQVNVTTQQNDIGRTGQNLNETILTLSTVNATKFGKLFSRAVDGYVYAQPLYLSNLLVNGSTHNVVFIATEHDSVYAFDADANTGANASPLWTASMLSPAHGAAAGATTVPWSTGSDIYPEVGITGTPVIDRTTNTLYVVSKALEGGNKVQRLHALDVSTGAEKFGGPVAIAASVSGTASDGSGGNVSFNAGQENQRPALLLLNGIVYIGWTAHEDIGPWHGWIIGYHAGTLQQTSAYSASPNGYGSGIWMSGNGLAADQLDPANHPFGRMFVATGNGDYTAVKPYSKFMDYGDSHLALDLTNGVLNVTDEFTTNQQATDASKDLDVGSGGLMVLPTQAGSFPHVLVQSDKQGNIYLLNRDNLGGYNTTKDQALQILPSALGGAWSAPAYWNGTVYYWGVNDHLKAFQLVNGLLPTTTPTQSSEVYGFPGATPAISANGTVDAIVWSINSSAYSKGAAVLRAHAAANVATTLYSSSTNAARDQAGVAVKFSVPTVANGKVYVGAVNEVDVYGLLSTTPPAATPTFSPAAGTYTSAQTVTIADTTPGAKIYYTTNGTSPTTASTLYSGPVMVSTSETLQAIAAASGYTNSAIGSAAYTISGSGTTPIINDPTGFSSSAGLNFVAGATLTNSTLQLSTAAGGIQAKAVWYATPVNVQSFTTDFTFQLTSAVGDGFTFALQNAGPNAVGRTGSGLGYQAIGSSVAIKFDLYNNSGEGSNSTGFYTNGGAPTVPAVDLTPSGVNLHNGNPVHAHITYNGTTLTLTLTDMLTNASFSTSTTINIPAVVGANTAYAGFTAGTYQAAATQSILNWTYSAGGAAAPAATPTFSPAAGTYTSAQTVTLADTTPGAKIYYTTNGTSPTTASTLYSGPVMVSTSETLQAIAAASGYTSSAIGSAAYTINSGTTLVNYPTGFSSSTGLNFVAGATLTNSTLQLSTAAGGIQAKAVWYGTPVNVQSFTTDFTFQLTSAVGDGFTFALQNAGPNAVGRSGSSLGYQGIGSSVAIKFDLYNNSGEGSNSTGFYTNGGAPTVPAVDLTPSGVNLHNGNTVHAHITYNGTTLTLTLTDMLTNASFSTSTTINIPAVVGANTAYAGFTAGTYEAAATQSILNWTYSAGGAAAPAVTPTFSPAAGTYTSAQTVTIADTTPGAKIYYTTNGTSPTTASTLYSAPVTVSVSEMLRAIAAASGYTSSAIGSAAYTINSGTTLVNYPTGFSSSTGLNFVAGATLTNSTLQLSTAAGGIQAKAVWYATPVNVQSFTTDFTFQLTSAVGDGFTFALQNAGPNAVGRSGSSLGYQGIGSSVAIKFDLYNNSGEGNNSIGFYTNGGAPTVPAVDLTPSGVNLHNGNPVHAHITYNGTTLTLALTDMLTNASFSTSTTINIPVFVGANTAYAGFTAGTYEAAATQSILNWTYAH